MDARSSDTSMEPAEALAGEPAFFGRGPATEDHPHVPPACLACGSLDLLTEPEMDQDEAPTGRLLVTCAACGREVGELAPPEPGPEAEPEPTEGSVLPGPAGKEG